MSNEAKIVLDPQKSPDERRLDRLRVKLRELENRLRPLRERKRKLRLDLSLIDEVLKVWTLQYKETRRLERDLTAKVLIHNVDYRSIFQDSRQLSSAMRPDPPS